MNNASKNPGLPQYSINIKGSKHGVCPKTKIGKMFDKGGFFSERKICFSNLPKKLYQKTMDIS